MKIAVTTRLPQEGFITLAEHELIMPSAEKFTAEELKHAIADCEILISTFDYKVTDDIIAAAPKLKMIANFGVGFNNINIELATRCGIAVTNTPEPVLEPTVEHTFTLMLAISHRIAELDRKLRVTDSSIRFGVMDNLGVSIMGKTLGIIGMGRIGQSFAAKAAVFGMNVIYHNRHRLDPQTEQRCDARYVSLEELLRSSDYVSLHLPYTPESHHIINDSTLSIMKDGAILINTARGACVKESDLVSHLVSGHLRGAALDVYEFEPKITPEMLSLDNVVLSPHIGTGTIECRIATGRCVSDNINAFIRKDFKRMNLVNEIKQ